MKTEFKEINEMYELEIEKIFKCIKNQKAKRILLQFPEGMKPYAQSICNKIEEKTKSDCFIWLGTCYGACDIPDTKNLNIDLIVQFGHSPWIKNNSY
jgi:2-(3-amino-3-carboxypropyl)histidine synthase